MTDPKTALLQLTKNLNILQEREAKYGGNAPLELLNQIDDHKQAIALTQQAIGGEISKPLWQESLKPLLLASDDGQVITIEANKYIAGDFHEHQHYAAVESPTNVKQNLPSRAYHRLIGRQSELNKAKRAVRDPENKHVIAIVGLGGIGKTALAREVAEWCLIEKCFKNIVWTSLKTEHFIGEQIRSAKSSNLTFDSLLTEIALQCGRNEVAEMRPNQRLKAVKTLLAEEPSLIIIDNLETARENEELVVRTLQILGKSKLILTSRYHLKHEQIHTIELMGLPEHDGVTFLREEGEERGVEAVATADHLTLREIHSAAGGAPLAMKLVVGQMSRQPMVVVLNMLKEASPEGEDYDFYWFLYRNSWDMLDKSTQMALVDMAVFPPVTGAPVKDVERISQVKGQKFWAAMNLLVMLSLVEKIGGLRKERFALHPLTQYFIRSDITKEWAK